MEANRVSTCGSHGDSGFQPPMLKSGWTVFLLEADTSRAQLAILLDVGPQATGEANSQLHSTAECGFPA